MGHDTKPRFIDSLPQPDHVNKIRVIILSASRTGTHGLYQAFKVLGYKPYHMAEIGLRGTGHGIGGITHTKLIREATRAANDPSSGIRPYGRAEFDKWFANYDSLIEIPSFLGGTSVVEAYIGDPDVKFILTERAPDGFAKSMSTTVGRVVEKTQSFPYSIFQYFDSANWELSHLSQDIYHIWTDGKGPRDPRAQETMKRNYTDYIVSMKKIVPSERLLCIRLEDGLGWEEICPYLGCDVPETPYPRSNDSKEFKTAVESFLKRGAMKAVGIMMLSMATLASVGWWLFMNRA